MNDKLKKYVVELEEKAKNMDLDWFSLNYELVPIEVMLEIMSYGLPTRARHWKYGQSYEYQKYSGEMGQSKVYELVLNNDPSYAFLLDTNPDIANIMVSCHVVGHSHFFKNNYLFKQTDRKMVYKAAERAQRIDEYINQYGLKKVENIMNIGFALEKNIDFWKGIYRKDKKPKKKKKENLKNEFDDLEEMQKDMFGFNFVIGDRSLENNEYDLLWFLINNCKLEDWEKDILEIIREESFYFYPQYMTKIMNEGFASYVHSELMQQLDISEDEFLEYSKIHERVVQAGSNKLNINPYFLGFKMLHHIKDVWDKKYEEGNSDIDGWQKILQLVETEDDISFIRNYLTKELVEELELFVYEVKDFPNGDQYLEIISKDLDDVKENLIKDIYNYRAPVIYVYSSGETLELVHENTSEGTLDINHLRKVLSYIYEIYKKPVDIQTIDEKGDIINITFDEEGCTH